MEVAVIGGGVVGASAAYHLLQRGARVMVVDRSDPGQATLAGAGILPALDHFSESDALHPLLKAARAHYPALVRALADDGHRDTGYAVVGALHVALDEHERDLLGRTAARARAWQNQGFGHIGHVQELEPASARALFPLLGPQVMGAVHTSGAARVDGRRLLAALRGAVEKRGGRWCEGNAELRVMGDRRVALRLAGGELPFDAVVVAAGSWSRSLARSVGADLPIRPQRGQLVHLDLPGVATDSWPIVMGFGLNYLVSFEAGRVVAGATREDAGHDARITAGAVRDALSAALQIAPGLSRATFREARVGFRPVCEDGRPVLGPLRSHPNLYFATGHAGYGLELGPYSGALIAEVVMGRPPAIALAAFSPDRFA